MSTPVTTSTLIAVVIGVLMLQSTPARADAHEDDMQLEVRPVEIYGCQFTKGNGMDELMAVVSRWNKWMDKEGADNYWAAVLVPVYHSDEIEADFLWVGGWVDGVNMGASTEFWLTKGGEFQKAFARVSDCAAHLNFATVDLKPLGENVEPGPVQFSNCKIADGGQFADAMEALNNWIEYEAETTPDNGHYVLFPAFGERSDMDYDFKWVSRSSWADFGAQYDMYGTGGGWKKATELFGNLLECDSTRVYQEISVRSAS